MQLFYEKPSSQVVLNVKFDLLDVSAASTPWTRPYNQFTLCEMQHSRG